MPRTQRIKIYSPTELQKLTNEQLIARINSLADFKWDDEGEELQRRKGLGLAVKMDGNKLIIIQ